MAFQVIIHVFQTENNPYALNKVYCKETYYVAVFDAVRHKPNTIVTVSIDKPGTRHYPPYLGDSSFVVPLDLFLCVEVSRVSDHVKQGADHISFQFCLFATTILKMCMCLKVSRV